MIEIKDLSFTYQGRDEPTLKDLNLYVRAGEFILVAGPTGCGKTTLLRTLNGLIPHETAGIMEGSVTIAGKETKKSSMADLTRMVGLVFQNPDDQIFSTRVEDEVAFGPENLCFQQKEIESSIDYALKAVGLNGFRNRTTAALSGGEKQRLAIAAALAMQPQVLALDEPFSQMDTSGTIEVLELIRKLNRKGMTIILVEHRIAAVFRHVSRIVIMEGGRIVLDEDKRKPAAYRPIFKRFGLWLPDDRDLANDSDRQQIRKFKKSDFKVHQKEIVLEARDIWFRYQKNNGFVLKGISLAIRRGEMVALLGDNGTGKSTLLLHFAAILKPEKGMVKILGIDSRDANSFRLAGKVGVVFQNPDLMLFCNSVRKEVEFGPRTLKLSPDKLSGILSDTLGALTIGGLEEEAPFSLSSGQRLRVATASIASMDPEIFLLDEPSQGQDRVNVEGLMNYLKIRSRKGTAILFITHNLDVALRYADRILFMNGGRIAEDV
ncbi:MAG: energy-coupling factor ABC transporter ATP-binding protein [Deltaproteobacteria bacterium]|nr:energy-coupling factor ABC transporter ATP-binding protein [Deltaproteobacteria bacterium]MBW2097630.1 energy-coupling factor ABC transporter ATP-binding protein [Deltaproteobacteria bacterium]